MDIKRLHEILVECTRQFRKGPKEERSKVGGLDVVEVWFMPHVDDAPPGLDMIDVVVQWVGVDKAKAETHRDEFIQILRTYPNGRLADGPSYIEVGAEIGSQEAAFLMFALGQTLGLWRVVTPASIGAPPERFKELAELGFVMITGFRGETPTSDHPHL